MKMTSRLLGLGAGALFTFLASPLFAADPDADSFTKSLKYTQDVIAKNHLIALVNIEPFEGGKKEEFRYDRYPTVERMQTKDGTFARKKGKDWLKSDDFAETGKKVKADKATELDALIGFADAPINNRTISKDKTQGGNVITFLKREKDGDSERLFYEIRRENSTGMFYPQFVFRPWKIGNNDDSFLIGYAGLMRSGEMRVKVNINYQYMFLVNAVVKNAGDVPKPGEKESPIIGAPTNTPPPPVADKPAEPEDPNIYDFTALQQNKATLNGKIVRLQLSTANALAKEIAGGQMHALVHDTAKPNFIGFVDFPKAQYKALGFDIANSNNTVIVYVRVRTKNPKDPATFTAVGRKAVRAQSGELAYEW